MIGTNGADNGIKPGDAGCPWSLAVTVTEFLPALRKLAISKWDMKGNVPSQASRGLFAGTLL